MASRLASGSRSPRFPFVVFCVALGLRIAVAAWQGLSVPPVPGSDEAEYVAYATSLAETGEYRGMSPDVADQHHLTAYRTPGTSLAYAALFRVFGHHVAVIRLFNCLCGALACLLILALGRAIASEQAAAWAAIIWALYPRALFYSASLVSESIGLLTFLAFLVAALRFAAYARWKRAVLAGFLLGVAVLVHPARVFIFPLVVLWAAWHFRQQWRSFALAALIPLVAIVTVLPWSIRNYVVLHHVIPLSTGGGSALLQGNNRIVVTDPRYYGYSIWDTSIPEYADALRAAGDEYTRDRIASRYANEWLRANTRYWPFLVKAKLIRGFTPVLQAESPKLFRLLELFAWGPVLVLMLIGFVPTWRRAARAGTGGWLVHLGLLHFAAVTVVFFGNSRYRYPVEPLAILVAAVTVCSFLERRSAATLRTPA